MAELTVENLHLKYGDNPILKGVALTLNRGEVVSLLGPSGSGKTTLLRAVAGLEVPHEGSIKIADKVVFNGANGIDTPAEGRNLGLVFQSYALWPHKTVYDNVAYGLKLRKIAGSDVKKRVNDALAQLSLDHLAERFPHQLSGGQQQRVALARALVYNPPVILLDEPLSNLDAKLREEARAWLRELIVRMQLSALCVTHDQGEALAMSDRILLLNGGKIEQQGTPQQMYSNPESLFTADFMGSNNRLTGRIVEISNGSALLEGTGWKLWGAAKSSAKSGTPGVGMIRLERIRIAAGPGDNHLAADLTTSMYLGDKWEHLFALGEERLRAYGDRPLSTGQHWLEVPKSELWVF
ncbi:MAG: ABC transporter ATP-binding protein [Betaproteobacteria bacterium]|nr:MAG: ABC transporter ATP-binding protein [Betaproteobacteria bacterium]